MMGDRDSLFVDINSKCARNWKLGVLNSSSTLCLKDVAVRMKAFEMLNKMLVVEKVFFFSDWSPHSCLHCPSFLLPKMFCQTWAEVTSPLWPNRNGDTTKELGISQPPQGHQSFRLLCPRISPQLLTSLWFILHSETVRSQDEECVSPSLGLPSGPSPEVDVTLVSFLCPRREMLLVSSNQPQFVCLFFKFS